MGLTAFNRMRREQAAKAEAEKTVENPLPEDLPGRWPFFEAGVETVEALLGQVTAGEDMKQYKGIGAATEKDLVAWLRENYSEVFAEEPDEVEQPNEEPE